MARTKRSSPSASPKKTTKSPKTTTKRASPKKSPRTKKSPKATGSVPKALGEFQAKLRAIKDEQGVSHKEALAIYRKQTGKASPKKTKKSRKSRKSPKKARKSQKVAGQITVMNPEPLKVDEKGQKVRYRHLDRHFYIRKTKDANVPLGYKVYVEVMSRGSKPLSQSAKDEKTAGLERYKRALNALAEKQSGSADDKKKKARAELSTLKRNKPAEYAKLLAKF